MSLLRLRPHRILVAHNVGRSRTGGMSRIMGFLHDEIARRGDQVSYFSTEDVAWQSPIPGVERFSFPWAVWRHVREEEERGRGYDIINVHEPSGALVSLLKRRLPRARVVVTSHGVEERGWRLRLSASGSPADRPGWKTRLVYPPSLIWQANLALRHADHVFCLNDQDRNYIAERFGRRESDITRIFPGAAGIYGEHAASRDYSRCRKLLFAGSWLTRKGTEDLAAAFNEVSKSSPDLQLIILNPGAPAEQVLADFPSTARARVEIRHAQPENGTAVALEDADLFVLPSLFEGTPLTLIEAMWSGLPIVTTATCGMKDVIEHRKNGLLVAPRDSRGLAQGLLSLIRNENLRRHIGSEAHLDARLRYSWLTVSEIVRNAYQYILERRPEEFRPSGDELKGLSSDRDAAEIECEV